MSAQHLPPELSPPFHFIIAVADARMTLTLLGELDFACSESLIGSASRCDQEVTEVVIDLSGLTFIDGEGVDALVAIRRAHVLRGRDVEMLHARRPIRRLFAVLHQEALLSA